MCMRVQYINKLTVYCLYVMYVYVFLYKLCTLRFRKISEPFKNFEFGFTFRLFFLFYLFFILVFYFCCCCIVGFLLSIISKIVEIVTLLKKKQEETSIGSYGMGIWIRTRIRLEKKKVGFRPLD